MIDDWVLWKDKPVQIARVSGVVYSFGHIDVTLAHCGNGVLETHDIKSISPIPITPEILEKNGFKKSNNYCGIEGQHKWTWWDDILTNVSLWCRDLGDKADDGWMISIESPISTLCVKVEFLHQLQHALRLCEIDKTIKL